MSLFPKKKIEEKGIESNLPMFTEYKWDFDKDEIKLLDGKTEIVTGVEALKVWVYKTLKTDRYKYLGYSWNYGSEIEDLLGKVMGQESINIQVEKRLRDALINDYIKDLDEMLIENVGDKLNISFTIDTIYGRGSINV